ncbi:hypothetical protein D3C80_1243330 [compost metagenome]
MFKPVAQEGGQVVDVTLQIGASRDDPVGFADLQITFDHLVVAHPRQGLSRAGGWRGQVTWPQCTGCKRVQLARLPGRYHPLRCIEDADIGLDDHPVAALPLDDCRPQRAAVGHGSGQPAQAHRWADAGDQLHLGG